MSLVKRTLSLRGERGGGERPCGRSKGMVKGGKNVGRWRLKPPLSLIALYSLYSIRDQWELSSHKALLASLTPRDLDGVIAGQMEKKREKVM